MKKLLAFDIDGTSIDGFRRVTAATIEALKKASQSGYILVPTTGRSLDGIPRRMLRELNLDYAITSNGARITDYHQGVDLKSTCIEPDKAAKIISVLQKHRVIISIHANGTCYDGSYFVQMMRRLFFNNDFSKSPLNRNLSKFVLEHELLVEKIQVFAITKKQLYHCLKDLEEFEGLSFPMSQKRYLEITTLNANKGFGVSELAAILGISLSDVVAIGDDTNDIPMFAVVGTSIAMGNALECVKEKANYTTDPNTKNGFAKAIIKHCT